MGRQSLKTSGTRHHRAAGNKPGQKADTGNNNGDRKKQSDFHDYPKVNAGSAQLNQGAMRFHHTEQLKLRGIVDFTQMFTFLILDAMNMPKLPPHHDS